MDGQDETNVSSTFSKLGSKKNDNLTVPWVCLQFLIVVFPDHTHYFWEHNDSVGKALDLGSRVASSIVTANGKTVSLLLSTGSTHVQHPSSFRPIKLFLYKLWLLFCSVEQNGLCNFGREHYEEHFCETILNLDQWLDVE